MFHFLNFDFRPINEVIIFSMECWQSADFSSRWNFIAVGIFRAVGILLMFLYSRFEVPFGLSDVKESTILTGNFVNQVGLFIKIYFIF